MPTPAGHRGAAATWRAQSPAMRGVLMMIGSTLCFSLMHVAIRHVSAEIPPVEIAFFRNLFSLLFLLPFLAANRFTALRTKRLPLHALRGLVNAAAMLLFFTALSIAPLAKVTALNFTAPVFAAALSVLVLGERFRAHRWLAIGTGFAGMLVVLRPGLAAVEPGVLMALVASGLWAVAMIVIKVLSRTESSLTIVGYMGIFLCLFSIGPALWVWVPPSPAAWAWMVVIGLIGAGAQWSLSEALRQADPGAVMPFDFLKLIWTASLAAWLFAEYPDQFTLLGACLIFGASLYIARRERRAQA